MLPRLAVAVALAVATAASASAAVQVGVADDSTKFAPDGGASLLSTLRAAGMTVNRVTVFWDERRPTRIAEAPLLDGLLPAAASAGVDVVVSVRPERARAFARRTTLRVRQFARFLQRVARKYPQVRQYVVGNEPNQPRFLQPQFDARGGRLSARVYERILAASYDALKAVSPKIDVIGLGLSARGNDDPHARDNVSISPVRFLAALGRAYRASGRRRPLMDELAFHPYPNVNTDPPGEGYVWPDAGIPDLDRIRQAVWDAFHGTAQPTFAEPGSHARRHLDFVIDELAWQVQIPPELQRLYHGRENVFLVDEQTQARYDVAALSLLECEPDVRLVLFFRLVDSTDLDRFQSGFLRADGSPRPALDAVKAAIAAPAACSLRKPWRHARGVIGARVRVLPHLRGLAVDVRAAEGAVVRARLVRRNGTTVAAVGGRIRAERSVRLRLAAPAAGGVYRVRVVVRAETDPARTLTLARSVRFRARGSGD